MPVWELVHSFEGRSWASWQSSILHHHHHHHHYQAPGQQWLCLRLVPGCRCCRWSPVLTSILPNTFSLKYKHGFDITPNQIDRSQKQIEKNKCQQNWKRKHFTKDGSRPERPMKWRVCRLSLCTWISWHRWPNAPKYKILTRRNCSCQYGGLHYLVGGLLLSLSQFAQNVGLQQLCSKWRWQLCWNRRWSRSQLRLRMRWWW